MPPKWTKMPPKWTRKFEGLPPEIVWSKKCQYLTFNKVKTPQEVMLCCIVDIGVCSFTPIMLKIRRDLLNCPASHRETLIETKNTALIQFCCSFQPLLLSVKPRPPKTRQPIQYQQTWMCKMIDRQRLNGCRPRPRLYCAVHTHSNVTLFLQ